MPTAPRSIVEAFLHNAKQTPEKTCIAFEGKTYTYAWLRKRAEAFAGALSAWGIEPGDRIALFLDNCPDFLAAYLGIWLAGGVVVLVNTQYRQVELRHILGDAGVRLCVTDRERLAELDRVRADLPDLAAVVDVDAKFDAFLASGYDYAPNLPFADDLAVIAYTSGTTGRSKGAMLLHRNLIANITSLREAWQWTADDHLLLALPLFHAHGLMVGAHGTLTAGATMTLHRRFDAVPIYCALCTEPLTMFFGVPTMYIRLLAEATAHTKMRPRPLRLFVSGSAPLSPQTFAEWRALTGQVILERYGMTETIMNTTNPFDSERRPGTVGLPFPRQEARVVAVRTREPLPDDETGEIEVRGPHVFAGYWQRPDATADAFDADGWFATGDLGHRSADGYYTISGRAKELIISGGYNIYPREVEEVLAQCPGVAEVAVVGLPDAEFGEQVAAVVVRDDPALTTDTLIAFCRDQLASYKKPRTVHFVDALPRNALGKVQKHIVRERILAL
ncbi:MAG: AMP-binding protein [Chloroflexota bacterium]|nr:AMP-binding protein [Chloroflexota bacterium]